MNLVDTLYKLKVGDITHEETLRRINDLIEKRCREAYAKARSRPDDEYTDLDKLERMAQSSHITRIWREDLGASQLQLLLVEHSALFPYILLKKSKEYALNEELVFNSLPWWKREYS